MKIGIMTFHRAYNYGAVLQAYALSHCIKKIDDSVEIIDYYPQYFRKQYRMIPEVPHSKRAAKQQIKRIIGRIIYGSKLKDRSKAFETFIDEYIPLSRKSYTKIESIEDDIEQYNIIITGSDQVWNDRCANFDRVFFLDFQGVYKKCSYAASFGFDEIPSDLKNIYQKRLAGYSLISVREDSGKRIINELLDEEATICCDPTLLLDAVEWKEVIEDFDAPKEDYIFLYYVTKADSVRKYAHKLAKEKNCRVIALSCQVAFPEFSGDEDRSIGFEVVNTCGPKEFVGYIANARYIVTNSFHGTVFSLLFHKNFKTQFIQDTKKKNNRVIELMEKLGLCERDLSAQDCNIDKAIDWSVVDKKIEQYRTDSINYLRKICIESNEESIAGY